MINWAFLNRFNRQKLKEADSAKDQQQTNFYKSTKDLNFHKAVFDLLKANKEVLVLAVYTYQYGNRDYWIINSEEEFLELVEKLKMEDWLTVFTSFDSLWRGKWTEESAQNVIADFEVNMPEYLLTLCANGYQLDKDSTSHSWCSWCLIEGLEEFKEDKDYFYGHELILMKEPNHLDDDLVIYAYGPDASGIGRGNGAY